MKKLIHKIIDYKITKKQIWVSEPTDENPENGHYEECEEQTPIYGDIYEDMTEEELAELNKPIPKEVEIEQILEELKAYDYIGTKIAMGVATREEYAEQIAHTEVLRARLRELE